MSPEFTALASVATILALVEVAKQFGIKGKWSTLLAVALGVLLSLIDAAGTGTLTVWHTWLTTGLLMGLSASGVYDVAVKVGGRTTGEQPYRPQRATEE